MKFPCVVEHRSKRRRGVAIGPNSKRVGYVYIAFPDTGGGSCWKADQVKVLDARPADIGYRPPVRPNMRPTPVLNKKTGRIGIARRRVTIDGVRKYRVDNYGGCGKTYWRVDNCKAISNGEYDRIKASMPAAKKRPSAPVHSRRAVPRRGPVRYCRRDMGGCGRKIDNGNHHLCSRCAADRAARFRDHETQPTMQWPL